ncbi:MAG: DUF983 domain-containing protein [Verrucomicrobiota bacterium]
MDSSVSPGNSSESRLQSCVRLVSKGSRFLWNATLLRCPVCGTQPLFVPLKKVKSLYDWSTPLDGCPKCGFPYEREAGYFLFAVWAFSYLSSIAVGVLVLLALSIFTKWAFGWKLALAMTIMTFFGFFFSRHAKAYFIALDHFCDPVEKQKSSGSL